MVEGGAAAIPSLPPAMPQGVLQEVAVEPGDGGRTVHLSVPFALLFFSADGVIVQYCVRVSTSRGVAQIAKRFSEVIQLDEHLNGNRWINMVTPSKLSLPKLTTATVGKTNSSLRAVAKRREELDRYFRALGDALSREHGAKRDALVRHVLMFLQCEASGPAALLPEAFRSATSGDHLVYAFWRVPDAASAAHSAGSVTPAADNRSPEARTKTPERRRGSPTMLPAPAPESGVGSRRSSGLGGGASRGGSIAGVANFDNDFDAAGLGPQVMRRITVALPRSLLYLDGSDHLTAALCSEKNERRPESVTRYRELLAFYNFVASNGDRIPTPDEARSFFLDRQAQSGSKKPAVKRDSSRIRNVDAQVTPPPDAAGSVRRAACAAAGAEDASPRREALLVAQNPIGGGVASHVPKGHGDAFALRVGVLPRARETGNSMHLVANETGPDSDFAPCLHCMCNDRQLCASGHERDRGSPRTSRYVMANDHWLDVTPPPSTQASGATTPTGAGL